MRIDCGTRPAERCWVASEQAELLIAWNLEQLKKYGGMLPCCPYCVGVRYAPCSWDALLAGRVALQGIHRLGWSGVGDSLSIACLKAAQARYKGKAVSLEMRHVGEGDAEVLLWIDGVSQNPAEKLQRATRVATCPC